MKWKYAGIEFETVYVEDNVSGSAGLELFRTHPQEGGRKRVATCIYWDATGQFFLQTFGIDLPVTIVEKLIADARAAVPP